MRYSEILGETFYKIKLTAEIRDLVDTHFSGAAHHYVRMLEARTSQTESLEFHRFRYVTHLETMMQLVYSCGDFSEAVDPSRGGFEKRESWLPQSIRLPDPDMFDAMEATSRIPLMLF
jgi:hypothetical protein